VAKSLAAPLGLKDFAVLQPGRFASKSVRLSQKAQDREIFLSLPFVLENRIRRNRQSEESYCVAAKREALAIRR
jgi:hypothetical protein